MAGVQDRHVVFLRERVDRGEQAREVGLGVDVLLAVGREQHVALGLKAELGKDVARLNLVKVRVQHLSHGRSRDVGALGGAAGVLEVATGVLGVVSVNIIFTISTNAFSPIAPTRIRRIRQRGCAAFGA